MRLFRLLFARGYLPPDPYERKHMRNTIIAGVRTAVQRLITIGLGALTAWLVTRGIEVDLAGLDLALFAAVDIAVTAGVTLALNALEKKFPWLTTVQSVGLAASPPQYVKADPQVPASK